MQLTLSLVRTKLSTSIERVAPSLGLSSDFFARDMVMGVFGGGFGGEGVLTVDGFRVAEIGRERYGEA